MKTFQDSTGREWEITINAATVKRVWDLCHIDLGMPDEGDPPLYARVMMGAAAICDILPAICRGQMEARAVDAEKLLGLLTGSQLAKAREAFVAEWIGFFRDLGEPAKAKVLDAGTQYYRLRMKLGADSPAVQRMEEALTLASQGDLPPATSAPESSA